jgi:serine/threonine-protein kinase
MASAVQAAERQRYAPEFLAAIDWALSPHEDSRPQSAGEWRQALLGTAPPEAASEVLPLAKAPEPQHQAFDAGFLKQVETELAQHLGPIAPVMVRNAVKKAHSFAELIHLLSADITHHGLRVKFERHFAELSRPVSQPQPQTGASTKPTRPSEPLTASAAIRFPAEVLERAERRLSQYLGPVSRVVVKRAAVKARDESELYLLIADEIENPAERKAFIRRGLSTSAKP